jgi:hypothetical protein
VTAGQPGRGASVPRGVGIAVAWACALGAGLVVVALVVDVVDRMLPTGSRATLTSVAPSDQQTDVGPYWYTRDQAEALSAELAAAVEGSTWCVGWSIVQTGDVPYPDVAGVVPYDTGDDLTGGFTSSFGEHADVGSSLGPGRSARTCSEWAEVEVVYEYTEPTSPLEDNAGFEIRASDPVVEDALRVHPALSVPTDALLHEDRDENTDDVIGNAIAALPLALAEQGRIDPLTVEPVAEGTEGAVTFDDGEGEGGNDMLVANRTALLVGALVVLAGLGLLCMAWGRFPARWFAPPMTAWPTVAPPGPPGAGAPAPWGGAPARPPPPARPGNPRRALKQQLERAKAREGAGDMSGGDGGAEWSWPR